VKDIGGSTMGSTSKKSGQQEKADPKFCVDAVVSSHKDIVNKMDWDKPKYNRKNRLKMEKFLSFLTVELKVPEGRWLGKDTGWTLWTGENGLEISGAVIGGVEYYNSIQYGNRLHNNYNNYVNPFYLFEIMSDDGRKFFLDMYREDIDRQIIKAKSKSEAAKKELKLTESFWRNLGLV
jgi:hypothetical protein